MIAEPAEGTVEMVHAAGGQMVSLHPSRVSNPAECARLVDLAGMTRQLYLASDESSYVTGIDLVVDGGMEVW